MTKRRTSLAAQSKADKLRKVREARDRWQRRLTRAHNAIVKLNRQEKWLTKPDFMQKHVEHAKKFNYPAERLEQLNDGKAVINNPPVLPPEPVEDDDLRGTVLDRTAELPAYQKQMQEANEARAKSVEADKKAMEEIRAAQLERAKIKAKAAAAKSKAKAKGELRKMPLQGKAALAKIREGC